MALPFPQEPPPEAVRDPPAPVTNRELYTIVDEAAAHAPTLIPMGCTEALRPPHPALNFAPPFQREQSEPRSILIVINLWTRIPPSGGGQATPSTPLKPPHFFCEGSLPPPLSLRAHQRRPPRHSRCPVISTAKIPRAWTGWGKATGSLVLGGDTGEGVL